jgi:hypothetical protein
MAESLALISKSTGPKIKAFVVMKPYQLPPDPWLSSIFIREPKDFVWGIIFKSFRVI